MAAGTQSKKARLFLRKFIPAPASQIPLINDVNEYASFEVSGQVLYDSDYEEEGTPYGYLASETYANASNLFDPTVCYVASGEVSLGLIKEDGTYGGLEHIGEATFNISNSTETIDDRSVMTPGMPNVSQLHHRATVELSMTCKNFAAKNLARFVFGEHETVAGASVTAEPFSFYPGTRYNPTKGASLTSVDALTVGGNTLVEYTAGSTAWDYRLMPTGVIVFNANPTTTGITAGDAGSIDYTFPEHDKTKIMNALGCKWAVLAELRNYAIQR